MTNRVRRVHFTTKFLLSVAGWLTVGAVALFVLVDAAQSRAQSPTDNKAQTIADTWQGTLHAGKDLRVVFKITKADDGGYKAVTYSIDQGGNGTGAVVPPPPDDPKAPPNLYTAMQEQLGLKMAPGKFPDDVIVIDHVEKPSEN